MCGGGGGNILVRNQCGERGQISRKSMLRDGDKSFSFRQNPHGVGGCLELSSCPPSQTMLHALALMIKSQYCSELHFLFSIAESADLEILIRYQFMCCLITHG